MKIDFNGERMLQVLVMMSFLYWAIWLGVRK